MPYPVPAVPPITPSAPPPIGLINSAPGNVNTTPGTTPAGAPGPGIPVTSYQPAAATASTAASTGYDSQGFEVPENITVASRLKGIIDSGSPLMQQAEANARAQMNARGLINSTQGITAGQSAVIDKATPIATADAAALQLAARDTGLAENAARQFGAAATNAASLANAAGETQTSQYNAGQTNASLSAAADASNKVGLNTQNIDAARELERIRTDTSLTLQDKVNASNKLIAEINADTSISIADKKNATDQIIAASRDAVTRDIADVQANTSLTVAEKANASAAALAALDNISKEKIAQINADTSLTLADKKAAIDKELAGGTNATTLAAQELQNAGSLANIKANGVISTKLQLLSDRSLETRQINIGAASTYNTVLTEMSRIQSNSGLSAEQKTVQLNDLFTVLDDSLDIYAQISGTPAAVSLISFSDPTAEQINVPRAVLPASNTVASNTPAIQNLYATTLQRSADPAGLAYWAQRAADGMPLAEIEASMKDTQEYRDLQ